MLKKEEWSKQQYIVGATCRICGVDVLEYTFGDVKKRIKRDIRWIMDQHLQIYHEKDFIITYHPDKPE